MRATECTARFDAATSDECSEKGKAQAGVHILAAMATDLQSLAGKRVTVMGLGRFGGGLGAARFLAARGAIVTVTDRKPASDFAEVIPELQSLIDAGSVRLALGGHDERDFAGADLVVANPAVPQPWTNQYLAAARNAGVPLTTEIALLIASLPPEAITIGITGSVGKSTTTAMIRAGLDWCGIPAATGGNIGGSLLDRVPLPSNRVYVLELSSAMLHWLGEVHPWSPRIAVCTNLSPNHMDWHGTLDHYAGSKQQILQHQQPGDHAVLGPTLLSWAKHTRADVTHVTDPLTEQLAIPGGHNRLNAAVALAAVRVAARLYGTPTNDEKIIEGLKLFLGLEHRLSLCHYSLARQRFYNDSKCTTVAACQQALASLAEDAGGSTSHIHLLVGGDAKGQDVSAITRLAPTLAGLYAIGRDGPLFAAGPERTFKTLAEAMTTAAARMKPGEVLLLSPACASWDQYPNYEHRGREFAELAMRLAP